MFVWLENTEIALWVSLSLWAYPALLALHITGLAIVVGIFSMRDLTLLGVVKEIEPRQFRAPALLAFAGFCLNAVSGLLLFSSQASYLAANTPFRIKLLAILLGMLLAWILQWRLREPASVALQSTRYLAAASLASWLVAISAGRLIAYLF